MINLAIPQIYISKIQGGNNLSLRSHAYSLRCENAPIAQKLPQDILSMGSIKATIIGALSFAQRAGISRQYLVIPQRVISAYDWLRQKSEHVEYEKFHRMDLDADQISQDCILINKAIITDEQPTPVTENILTAELNRHSQPYVEVLEQIPEGLTLFEENRTSVIVNSFPTTTDQYLQIQKSNNFLSDYDPAFWTLTFVELFCFGTGGFNNPRLTLTLQEWGNKLMQSTCGRFRKHPTFWATLFDVLSRRSASNAIYVKAKVNPGLLVKSLFTTKTDIDKFIIYQNQCTENWKAYKAAPTVPDGENFIFATKQLLSIGESNSYGSSEERKSAQRDALAMEAELGQVHAMLTICPDSSGSYRIMQTSNFDSRLHFDLLQQPGIFK